MGALNQISKEIRETLIEAQEVENPEIEIPFPQMSPDLFDEFVDYLYDRVDLPSFKQSSGAYKLRMFKKFVKSRPDRIQLTLQGLNKSS